MVLSTRIRPSGLRDALNTEWAELAADGGAVPANWRLSWQALTDSPSLDDLLARVRERPDPMLHALLALSADGDRLAARVVLQAMLGKLVRMSLRDPEAGLDDYVSAMWLRIRTYPLAGRPTRIAANLSLDTLKAVHRQCRAPRGVEVTPYPPSAFVEDLLEPAAVASDELAARRVIQVAARLGLINEETRAVLTSVYVDGLTGALAAARHGKSPAAIRFQCHKAVHRLAQHAQALVEAA